MNHLISKGFSKLKRIPILFTTVLLTGCSSVDTSSDLYQNIKQQTDQFASNSEEVKQNSLVYLTEQMYNTCITLKRVAPAVMIISWVVGGLLLHLITEDQTVRKKVLTIFIIGIPVLMFVASYGLSWLVGNFL